MLFRSLLVAFVQIWPALVPLIPLFIELALMLQKLLVDTGALKLIMLGLQLGIAMLIVVVKVVVGIIQGWIWLSQKLLDMYRAIGKTIWEFFSTVKNVFGQIGGIVRNAVGSIGNTLYNAGQSVIQGLWNGIKSMAGWLAANVRNFIANTIPGPVARFLGIGSPAKLMIKMAKWIPAGIAVGMDAGRGLVADAATRLAMAAMPALQVAAPGVPSVGGYGMERDSQRSGDTYFLIDLGDGVKTAVKAVLIDDPALVASSTDEGRRQRSFASSPRARP